MMSIRADAYTKLYDVLEKYYTEKQINEIWDMLIEYDLKLNKLKGE